MASRLAATAKMLRYFEPDHTGYNGDALSRIFLPRITAEAGGSHTKKPMVGDNGSGQT
jgi:hypothetical protein